MSSSSSAIQISLFFINFFSVGDDGLLPLHWLLLSVNIWIWHPGLISGNNLIQQFVIFIFEIHRNSFIRVYKHLLGTQFFRAQLFSQNFITCRSEIFRFIKHHSQLCGHCQVMSFNELFFFFNVIIRSSFISGSCYILHREC